MPGRPNQPGRIAVLLALVLITAACAPAAPPPSPAGETQSPNAADSAAPTGEAWRTAELHDARTGEAFRIAELVGHVVVIEPMAIWCASCRVQQDEAQQALERLAPSDLVYISLDVDPNETAADLAGYADDRGYPWRFVVAPRDVARSLAEAFGDQVLSPPSTPKIVVAPDGAAEVSFGIKTAAELETELSARLP